MLSCGVVKYRAMSVTCSLLLQHMSLSRKFVSFLFCCFIIYDKPQYILHRDFPKRFHTVSDYMKMALRDFLITFSVCHSASGKEEKKGDNRLNFLSTKIKINQFDFS